MKNCSGFSISLALALAVLSGAAKDQKSERELIEDNHFHHGFILWQPKPGQHVRYGELKGLDSKTKPVWGLSQWSSKFPLEAAARTKSTDGVLVCSNSAKSIVLGPTGTAKADFSMAVNTGAEYGATARKGGEPWVHLLVEQEFDSRAPLKKISAAKLHVEARLLQSRNLHRNDYTTDLHAAQFQIFFTVQNRNQKSPGYGDLLWFGIPIYDNRHRFVPEFKAQDFGGTAKFIFTSEGKRFTSASTHDGEWVIIEKDLLPWMREALETAWAGGFLKDSKQFDDYYIGGMNMGWELPGTFDVEVQVRNLSLKLAEK